MKKIFNNLLDGKDLSLSEADLLVESIFKSNIFSDLSSSKPRTSLFKISSTV